MITLIAARPKVRERVGPFLYKRVERGTPEWASGLMTTNIISRLTSKQVRLGKPIQILAFFLADTGC